MLLFGDLLALAVAAVRAKPARSAVMAFGPAVAVAVVLGTFGVLRTSTSDIQAEIDRLGVRLVKVRPDSGSGRLLPPGAVGHLEQVDGVAEVVPIFALDEERSPVALFSARQGAELPLNGFPVGATERLFRALSLDVDSGRALTGADEEHGANVAVLGHRLAEVWRTAGAPDVVTVRTTSFYVVGTLAPSLIDDSVDSTVFVPVAASTHLRSAPGPTAAFVVTDTADVSDDVARAAKVAGGLEAPQVRLRATVASGVLSAKVAIDGQVRSITYAVGGLVALVGALAIANVQSVAVLERRPEIGVRSAMGQAKGVIASQFVLEAVIVGAAGGLAGVLMGAGGAVVWGAVRGKPPVVPLDLVLPMFGASILVAVVASVVPARRAMRVAPVDSLRSI